MSEVQVQSPRFRLITSFVLSLFVFAASAVPASTQSKGATPTPLEIAKRVDDHYNRLQSLRAQFNEQYEGLGMRRNESGVMLLRKPGKMRWDYQNTKGKVFVLDGKYAWFYSPGQSQVQRIPASKLDDLRSPLRFLLGHTKIESELTGLALASSGGGSFTLTGIPKGQEKRITKLSLTVTATGTITGISIEEVDGAKTSFAFSSEEPNASIPEAQFHFTPPTGVPVVDALPPV